MRQLKTWLWICGLTLFAAGASVGGLFGSRLLGPGKGNGALLADPPGYRQSLLVSSEEVWKELSLNKEQRDELQRLLTSHYQQVDYLQEYFERLSQRVQAEVGNVLTPPQRLKLADIQQRYTEARIENDVTRDMALVRVRVGLSTEQASEVWPVLFDNRRERRKAYGEYRELCRKRDSRASRVVLERRLRELSAQKDDLLARILDAEQLAKYRAMLEERRSWYRKNGDRRDKAPSSRQGQKKSTAVP